jgi:hypothetical protein
MTDSARTQVTRRSRLRLHPRVRQILQDHCICTLSKHEIADRLYAEAYGQRRVDRALSLAAAALNFRNWAHRVPDQVHSRAVPQAAAECKSSVHVHMWAPSVHTSAAQPLPVPAAAAAAPGPSPNEPDRCRIHFLAMPWQAALALATRRARALFRVFRYVHVTAGAHAASYADVVVSRAAQGRGPGEPAGAGAEQRTRAANIAYGGDADEEAFVAWALEEHRNEWEDALRTPQSAQSGWPPPPPWASAEDWLRAVHGLYLSLDRVHVLTHGGNGDPLDLGEYAPYRTTLCARPCASDGEREAVRRVAAQLHTARRYGARHLLLPVARCSRQLLPSVALAYRSLLLGRFAADFDHVAFYCDRHCTPATLAQFRNAFANTASA